MSYLIFCSFEVGGLPYKMAEVLNKYGIKAYYVSLARNARGHDSTAFHYGKSSGDWDLSSLFDTNKWPYDGSKILRYIKSKYDITYSLAVGHKSYLLKQIGIDYGYWCYGADLDQYCKVASIPEEYPFWKKILAYIYFLLEFCREQKRSIPSRYPFWKKILAYVYFLLIYSHEQRKSIMESSSLAISHHQLEIYQKLCPGKRLFFVPHLINVIEYKELCKKKNENKRIVCDAIKAENFFFSPVRHLWSEGNRTFTDYKGNDVILRSFAHYLKMTGDYKSKLVLVRKGPDVGLSKKLIVDLGIDYYVVWLDEMKRDDIRPYYQGASVCFGQFGTPLLNHAVLEPLSNATPCVSFAGNNADNIPFYRAMPPILNTKDTEKIVNFMCKIISDVEYASNLCYNSWVWAKQNCSEEKFIETFLMEMQR